MEVVHKYTRCYSPEHGAIHSYAIELIGLRNPAEIMPHIMKHKEEGPRLAIGVQVG